MTKAIILLSGGIDSAVCALIAKKWGFEIHALSFNYGQRHILELEAAQKFADKIGATHKVVTIPVLGAITSEQPYVPARNTIFLALACGFAEALGATELFIGINADDSYFPDCSSRFYHAFASLASVAFKQKVNLHAPLLHLTKADVIKIGVEFGVPFEETLTCYNGTNCGTCPACVTRKKAFEANGMVDPLKYWS